MFVCAKFSGYIIIGLLVTAQPGSAQSPAKEAFDAGDFRTALKLYSEALDANPNDTTARFYQGLCYFNLGDYDQSITPLHQVAIFSTTFRARAFYFVAKAEEASGLIHEALSSVKSSLRADSTFAPAQKLQAQLLCATRQYAAALQALDSTATADVLLALGNCLASRGRYDEAAKLAQRALAADSTSVAAKLLLAEAYSYSDSVKRGCELYFQLYDYASRYPRIFKKLAACYVKDGQHQSAVSFLKLYVVATGDSSASVLADIGRIYHSQSRFDSAAVYFSLAVQQDSTAAVHYYNLGLAYFQLKEYRAAERAMRQAIQLSEETLRLCSKQHYMLGAAYMNQNKPRPASQAYRKSIDLNSSCWECYYFLGTVYQSLGDETNAATWYRRFLQRAPKTQQLADMRAAAAQCLKEFRAAKK